MTLAVGDLCTVAFADGGFRVALPVEIAQAGQQAYLADFGTSQTGLPIQIKTVAEVAATVAENEEYPRLQRVIGTIVRDANNNALFVPLGVMPPPEPETPDGTKTLFVVFADTSPIESFLPDGITSVRFPMYRRTPGEYDVLIARTRFETIPPVTLTGYTVYLSPAITIQNLGSGNFREIVYEVPITVLTSTQRSGDYDLNNYNTYYTGGGPQNTIKQVNDSTGSIAAGNASLLNEPAPWYGAPWNPPFAQNAPRTFQHIGDAFHPAIGAYRQAVEDWPDPPPAIVYHVPLASDALRGAINEIFPPGTTDTAPLEVIRQGVPTASSVATLLIERSQGEGIREVRFITASASNGGVARMQTIIGEVIDLLRQTYPEMIHSTVAAPGNDWMDALITAASDVPEE